MRVFVVALACTALLVATSDGRAEASAPVSLHGRLVDPEGAPLAGVRLRIAGTDLVAVTDELGRFVFSSLPAGPITVVSDDASVRPLRVHAEVGPDRPREPLVVQAAPAPLPSFAATVVGTRLAPRPLPHGARGAPLAMLDATLGYRWEWLTIDLAAENLLNLPIREGEYHFASDWRRSGASAIPVVHTVAGPPLHARLSFTAVH